MYRSGIIIVKFTNIFAKKISLVLTGDDFNIHKLAPSKDIDDAAVAVIVIIKNITAIMAWGI